MKALIAITTCQRLHELKKNVVPFLDLCATDPEFDFVVALDGREDDVIEFCGHHRIPLIYSDEREGVGLSRNRVCLQFPDYDYYFFVDDDVELMDGSVFRDAVELSKATGYHHFSPTHTVGVIRKEQVHGHTVIHSEYGGGHFMMYSNEALQKVGGWHTLFAKYRRFGHTEHTYRVYHQGLNPAPFVFSKELGAKLYRNSLPPVSTVDAEQNKNHLIREEQELIDGRFDFLPLATLSKHFVNDCPPDLSKVDRRIVGERYGLIEGVERRGALGRYWFEKFVVTKNPFFLLRSYLYDRSHKHLRHYLKVKYLTWAINLGLKESF